MKTLTLILSLIVLPVSLLAQTNPSDPAVIDSLLRSRYDERTKSGVSPPENPATKGTPVYIVDEQAKESLGAAIYEDYLWSLKHNRSAYEWQGFSTQVIFYVVILLVFVGVVFSGLQFFKAFRVGNSEASPQTPDYHTELEISTKGVKVSSPVLGIIILAISLAFFYLYLVHVYPINLPQ